MNSFIKYALAAVMGVAFASCSNDNPQDGFVFRDDHGSMSIAVTNPQKWAEAAQGVANELHADLLAKVSAWEDGLAAEVKSRPSAEVCAGIVTNCASEAKLIAGKISTPKSGLITMTADDLVANLGSIRNSLFGSIDGQPSPASLIAVASVAAPQLQQAIVADMQAASAAIKAIPAPLLTNGDTPEAQAAQAACLKLNQSIAQLAALVEAIPETQRQAIVNQYVDGVVLPSVRQARAAASQLVASVDAMIKTPDQQTISAMIQAYVQTRGALDLCEAFIK